MFCTGDDDRNVCIWTLDSKNPFKIFTAHSSEIACVAFSPDERVCASGSQGGTVLVWDLEGQKITASLKEHRVACTALAVPPISSPLLATGSQDTNVKVWDMRTAKSIYTLKGHEDKISTVVFSPGKEWIASGDDCGIIKIWSLQNSKVVAELKTGSAVNCIAFNPEVYALASGNEGKTLRYWDLEEFNLISETPIDTAGIRRVCFTPNGKHIFSATDEAVKVSLFIIK